MADLWVGLICKLWELKKFLKITTDANFSRPMERVFELLLPPPGFEDFRWVLLAIIAGNIVACVLLEDVVVEIAFRKFQNW